RSWTRPQGHPHPVARTTARGSAAPGRTRSAAAVQAAAALHQDRFAAAWFASDEFLLAGGRDQGQLRKAIGMHVQPEKVVKHTSESGNAMSNERRLVDTEPDFHPAHHAGKVPAR